MCPAAAAVITCRLLWSVCCLESRFLALSLSLSLAGDRFTAHLTRLCGVWCLLSAAASTGCSGLLAIQPPYLASPTTKTSVNLPSPPTSIQSPPPTDIRSSSLAVRLNPYQQRIHYLYHHFAPPSLLLLIYHRCHHGCTALLSPLLYNYTRLFDDIYHDPSAQFTTVA